MKHEHSEMILQGQEWNMNTQRWYYKARNERWTLKRCYYKARNETWTLRDVTTRPGMKHEHSEMILQGQEWNMNTQRWYYKAGNETWTLSKACTCNKMLFLSADCKTKRHKTQPAIAVNITSPLARQCSVIHFN